MNQTTITLQKRHKLIVPKANGTADSRALVASIEKNLEQLGYTLTKRLALALSKQDEASLTALYEQMITTLREGKGAHVTFAPMYPNFPKQVMEMGDVVLFWNAIFHYLTLCDPNIEAKEERLPLSQDEGKKLVSIDLGTKKDYHSILTELAAANSSLSDTDKSIFVFLMDDIEDIADLLPDSIPQKETLALIGATLIKKYAIDAEISGIAKTATDVLRIATQLSSGDVSLADETRYISFSRPVRRILLQSLEACSSLEEDLLRHKGKWLRLAERLHPRQYKCFPRTQEAFRKLRNGEHIATFASDAEAALKNEDDWQNAVKVLSARPGDFLRRLDHVLRTYPSHSTAILNNFLHVADKAATPALLSLHQHFINRQEKDAPSRQVFPKGSTSKMKVIPAVEKEIKLSVCKKAVDGIEAVLVARFAKLPSLGEVFLDPELANYPVPFAQRSASKALRTLPRGSHAPLDSGTDKNLLRFFIWWKNGDDRTDLDLSAALLKEDFSLHTTVAYYNLRDFGGTHSGDIVDAPNGACEFIDIDIEKLKATGVRYVAAVVSSFTRQAFRDLPECFCGWMTREHAQQGEVFEAKTVENKADLSGDTQCAIPVIIDLEKRKAIWCDISLGSHPQFPNNVDSNKGSISLVCKNMASLNRPSLHTLLRLHAEARGTLTKIRKEAKTVFAPTIAYEGTRIAAEFLQ